ncbi:MAG: rod shape-determining protein MreC [Betaproteobacteria bacterium RIFCSPLOWO2_12_FULL_65_14]|nr:MAG: rod shape-determining protein MreC [Betaproteobacteria bacterium RIFCSPLOWO2_12_FULL_65_14]
MEHSPPPFFKRGPAPLVRLFFFASLSLALLVIDARFRYAEGLRNALAIVAYPLQRAATAPIDFLGAVGAYLSTQAQLVEDNAALRAKALALSQDAQRYQAAEAEAAQLRRLIGAAERIPVKTLPAELLYAGRDPYSHKVFIDRGSQHGIKPGSPVADEAGVVGQVTRVHPLISEVTLLTDRDQAIPVQVVRSGLRAVAFGSGPSGMVELRFMAADAEIQNGDRLVTSGIDGTYPPGLPVATVVRIERDAELSFVRVVSRPAAGVDRGRFVLVLSDESARPARPEETVPGKDRRKDKSRHPRSKGKDGDGR